ncbi:MAG: 30S ribosomal protein S6 [Candidatus Paceibacterota bacterium]|jgi:ribosomal protein S6
MEYYDINFLILTSLDKGQFDSTVSWLDSKFNVAADSAERKVQRRKLAYPIKKEIEAWHYQLRFIAPADISPKFFEELRKEMKERKEIIRSMIVKKRDEPPAKEKRVRLVETENAENNGSPIVATAVTEKTESKPEAKIETVVETKKEKKIQLQEIDQKLEEILKEE